MICNIDCFISYNKNNKSKEVDVDENIKSRNNSASLWTLNSFTESSLAIVHALSGLFTLPNRTSKVHCFERRSQCFILATTTLGPSAVTSSWVFLIIGSTGRQQAMDSFGISRKQARKWPSSGRSNGLTNDSSLRKETKGSCAKNGSRLGRFLFCYNCHQYHFPYEKVLSSCRGTKKGSGIILR